MRIGVSKSLAHTGYPVVTCKSYDLYDVTVIVQADMEGWHEQQYKRIRPHFVLTEEEALHVLGQYASLTSS